MNGRSGLTSFLVAIAAAISVLVPLEKGYHATARSPVVVSTQVADSGSMPHGQRVPILGSDLVCQYVHAGRDQSGQPAGHCDNDTIDSLAVISRVIIAILPDPLDSHLDWGFDAALESIQRAFEHSNFVPDRYWLPWRPVAHSGRGDSDSAAELRASFPGVMLFRRSSPGADTLALVYLIGETPTRGIQSRAFRVALADIDTLLARKSSGWTVAPDLLIASRPCMRSSEAAISPFRYRPQHRRPSELMSLRTRRAGSPWSTGRRRIEATFAEHVRRR
jgi:hypothetical protein